MSQLPGEDTGDACCLVLQASQENAEDLRPDVFAYHGGLVIKRRLTLLHLVLLSYGCRNSA